MRIILVAMPWHSLDTPSLAIGILHERARLCRSPHEIIDVYANLKWAEFLHTRSQGQISVRSYTNIADLGIWNGMGDWAFAPALHGTEDWKPEEYYALVGNSDLWKKEWLFQVQRWTPAFIEQLADEVLAMKPDVVGFTSTFMQNVPSFALAKALKQRQPSLITMMGGANCDGPQGLAVHRNFPMMDFVVRGEGEAAFVELLDALDGHGAFEDIQGLCWRKEGRSIANPERTHAFPSADVPAPNYDAYFKALQGSSLREAIEPKLVMEGARGCWWGEKHHCTFCGLNGSMMKFRSKPPTQLWEELRSAVEKYQVLDVYMVDNIMDQKYFKTLLPLIAESGMDLRVQYEVKSNLNLEQIKALKAAGVVSIQPGIESLSTHVLKLMAKGVNGCHNIQTLRDCAEYGLTVTWNYLFGFPGEEPVDYTSIVDQVPALVHLQPPSGANRILLERFSPNFENPSLGFAERTPARFYPIVYELPEHELMDLAYLFWTPPQGIGRAESTALSAAVDQWQDLHGRSELSYVEEGRRIHIHDRRAGFAPGDTLLEDPVEVAMFHLLRRPQSDSSLAAALRTQGHERTPEQVAEVLGAWKAKRLLFEEAGRFIALPVRANVRRIRIAPGTQRALPRPQGLLTLPGMDDVQVPLGIFAQGTPDGAGRVQVRMTPEEWPELLRVLPSRQGGPAIAVVLQGASAGAWPSREDIDALVQHGVVEVRVPWEMDIGGASAEEGIHFVRFLRDCTARRLRVQWQGGPSGAITVDMLNHLEPPVPSGEVPSAWNELHGYGRCYWRAGGGFMVVKDARTRGSLNRFTLEDGPLREVFNRLAVPQQLAQFGADEDQREALEALLEEKLVLKLDDWLVALPYQIQHWPTPFMVI